VERKIQRVDHVERSRLRPFLAVPILRDGDTVGVIRVCDKEDGVFSESDLQVMTLVASHVSNALAYSDRYGDKLNLLDKLRKLMLGTREFAEIDKRIDSFEQSVLDKPQERGGSTWYSILTIYKFDPESVPSIRLQYGWEKQDTLSS